MGEYLWPSILVMLAAFLVLIVIIFGIYFVLSRRGMKQQRHYFEKLHQELHVGKKVICAQGIYGTIKKLDQEKAEIEIAEGVIITVSRYAINDIVHD